MSGSIRRVLALLALSWGLSAASCGGAEEPPAPAPEPAPAEAAAPTAEGAGAPQEPGPVLGPREADMSELRVTCLSDEEGQPVAGLRVRLLWKSGEQDTDVGRAYQMTGLDGVARFQVLGGTIIQSVAAEPSALTAPEALVIKKPILPATEVELELRVKPAGTLAGVVRNAGGEPVVGAEVVVWFDERWNVEGPEEKVFDVKSASYELGSFTVGGLPQGAFTVEARKEGMIATRRATGRIRTGQVLDGFELVLEEAQPYFGRVVDEDGEPVAGAGLVVGMVGRHAKYEESFTDQAIYVPAAQVHLVSDADGVFEVAARPPSQMWVVEAKRQGYQDTRKRILPGEGAGDVVMPSGFTLSGQVLDPDRRPVGRALLRLRGEQQKQFRTGEGGGYRAEGLREDLEAALLVYKPGFAPTLVWPVEVGPDAEALPVLLRPGLVVSGRVVGPDGEGIAGARIQIVEELPSSEFASLPFPGGPLRAEFGIDQALTASDGRFVLTDLPPGELRLRVFGPDGVERPEVVTEPGTDELEIRID